MMAATNGYVCPKEATISNSYVRWMRMAIFSLRRKNVSEKSSKH
jgi:hypothetical protein